MGELTCFRCGILFGVPDCWEKARRGDKESFYCPNGHSQAFVTSEADKLRLERDRLKQQLACKDDDIARERRSRELAEHREAAAKGQITKLKKRASVGVCPCCNRTFGNLASHMKIKHPAFAADDVSNIVPIKGAKA